MAEPHRDHGLYSECLAAMASSGDAYPCELLAHSGPEPECALPEPLPVPGTASPQLFQSPRS